MFWTCLRSAVSVQLIDWAVRCAPDAHGERASLRAAVTLHARRYLDDVSPRRRRAAGLERLR